MSITQAKAINLIKDNNGRIFSACYTARKTGQVRKMVARMGVSKGVKGVGLAFDPASKGLLSVFKMGGNGGYRLLNLRGLHTVTVKGITYKVDKPFGA